MTATLAIVPTSGGAARAPGDVLELEASWSLPETPPSLEARLFWFTRGKGTPDVGIVATERLFATGARGDQRVKFRLPDAPYSFSGRLISLLWAVELVPGDAEAARWEFVLAPEGKEIRLEQPKHARLR